MFCGGEENVTVSLSVFGLDSVFVTKSQIIYGDGRMALYYLERGESQRPSKVIYDRMLIHC